MESTTDAVTFEFEAPPALANWRPLVQWLLAVPHLIIASVLGYAAGVVAVISFFAVLFTRQVPNGLHNFQVMVLRYRTRTTLYAGFLHDQYPAFDFTTSAADPGGDPSRLSIAHAAEQNRWMPIVKWIAAIPHFIMLLIYGIGAAVLWIVNFFIVLFTGTWNESHRAFIVKTMRYQITVMAYVYFLRDEYPSFSLS